MLTNLLKIVHATLIVRILLIIANSQICPPVYAVAELVLTLMRSVAEKNFSANRSRFQILLSMMLGYTMFPNKMRSISWVFLFKTIQVHQTLKSVRRDNESSSKKEPYKYFIFFFDIIRFSLNQFMFMGILSIAYRFFCDSIKAPIPDPYAIIYQLIVTASTIGYGDHTPKTRTQIIFITCIIPFLCASFVIYINSLVDIYTNTFLEEEKKEQSEEKIAK